MLVKVKDIVAFMEGVAPSQLAEDWDNTGLAVGDPDHRVKKVLVALDVIDSVVEEAVEIGADLILTHHPMLLFRKINSITKTDALGRRIYKLIENEVAALSAHTNLDVAKGGTNDVLAEMIGLTHVEILEETWAEELKKIVVYVPQSHLDVVREAMCAAGAGHIGSYSHCTFQTAGEGTFLPQEGTSPYIGTEGILEKTPEVRLETIAPGGKVEKILEAIKAVHPYEEVAYDIYPVEQKGKKEGIGRIGDLKQPMVFSDFALVLKEKLGLEGIIRLVGDSNKEIQRVGLCTGSGTEFFSTAKKQGADLYLTGDLKFHEAQKALELGLCVGDITHYASEVIIVPVLQKALLEAAKQKDWDLEVVCSKVNGQTFWTI
ncbi:putative GTP cyclohydrolase 1 type 2 [Anaerotignum neopropionicum]|uniref:GTP cyclohydrolase 1 type 2 homolog n=1 Tax=Anaerotignum neopropionicum TaxID=36847 RepID=A0A136WHT7_9FIRM|nr:Nif3-like dinuclear metal center hexameric protein [Anaerotignum neopropionicum]KXL54014.1 putative GTP cyclohydrolase 1 type 2 [Anaerotignum neopropionicum]